MAAMLIARPVLVVAAKGSVAAIYAERGAMPAWQEAGARLPVCRTLIDVG